MEDSPYVGQVRVTPGGMRLIVRAIVGGMCILESTSITGSLHTFQWGVNVVRRYTRPADEQD